MKRLALVPVVVCPVAVVAWWSGLVWPIATTAYAAIGKRRLIQPESEGDPY